MVIFREQDFMNYLSLNDYRNAILLALAMDQPGRLYKLFKDLPASSPSTGTYSITGHPSVDEVIRTLGGADLAKLLRRVRDWNSNARTSDVAQRILHAVVKLRAADDIIAAFGEEGVLNVLASLPNDSIATSKTTGASAIREIVEALIPYTERHLARMEKLVQESYIVDYLLGEMDDGRFDGLDSEVDEDHSMDVDRLTAVEV